MPINLGATFDDVLVEKVATVISTEARALNNANRTGLDFWSPNINPFKDPRWGRGAGRLSPPCAIVLVLTTVPE
jgi:beta-D-xylosidase 4